MITVRNLAPASVEPLPSPCVRQAGRNVLFVGHSDFTGQSAYHVHPIAAELAWRGRSPAIAVPGRSTGVRDLGRPNSPVLSFRDAHKDPLTAVRAARQASVILLVVGGGPLRLRDFGARAAQRVSRLFDATEMARRTRALYDDVLALGPARLGIDGA